MALSVPRTGRAVSTFTAIAADYRISLAGLELASSQHAAALAAVHERSAQRLLELARANGGVYVKAAQACRLRFVCIRNAKIKIYFFAIPNFFLPRLSYRGAQVSCRDTCFLLLSEITPCAAVLQYASTVQPLPAPYREALATLQDAAPSRPFEEVAAVLRRAVLNPFCRLAASDPALMRL